MTDLVLRLSLEQSLEVQDALRRNSVSLAELKKLTSGENLRKAIDFVLPRCNYRRIELPQMVGKSLREVCEYLKKTHGEEKFAKIPNDLDILPDEFKDGRMYYFFGLLRRNRGEVDVPSAFWAHGKRRGGWDWVPLWDGSGWKLDSRAVLLAE